MRKILSLLVAAILCCSLVSTAFAASGDYAFSVQTEGSPAVGDTITVTLSLSKSGAGEFDLYAMQDYVRFDPAYFTYVDQSLSVYTVKNGEQERAVFSASPLDFDEDGVIDRVYVNRASTNAEKVSSGVQVMQFQLRVKAQGNTTLTQSGVEIFQDPAKPDSYHAAALNITTRSADSTGGSSGSGGSGGNESTYPVSVDNSVRNGGVTPSRRYAKPGERVTITVTANSGYVLSLLSVIDAEGNELALTDNGDGTFTFTQPASKVEIKAVFAEKSNAQTSFVDVPAGSYYADAVIWAVGKGITTGTSTTTFSPDGICTRAQAVTFLWRAAGSPAPKSTAMPFTDVPAGSYYHSAVLWAIENGITKGTSDTTFSPDADCTRAQIVTFLWRAEKSPAAGSSNPFTDVAAGAYYADAVLWAVKENITNGSTPTTFSPDANCTRAQIVTFLYRCMK